MSVSNEWPFVERRGPNRPESGDRRPCPGCGDAMRFYERYVVRRGHTAFTQPAWVCRCGHEEYVRKNSADADSEPGDDQRTHARSLRRTT